MRRLMIIALFLVSAAGCARMRSGSAIGPRAVLLFTNDAHDQAIVFANVSGGSRSRIGSVMSGRTDSLTLPGSLVGTGGRIVIGARLLAARYIAQTSVTLEAGDRYQARLSADGRTLSLLPAR